MKVAILGSTGFLGQVLLEKALQAGHQVRTLVRNPEKLGKFKAQVDYVQGNVFNADDVAKAVTGTEAVISTVGPTPRDSNGPDVYRQAMVDLVGILNEEGIKRYIHTGGAVLLGGENEHWTIGRRVGRFIMGITLKRFLASKEAEWAVLRASDLDWTLVRPPAITKGAPTGDQIVADDKHLASLKINVEDLAEFMLAQLTSSQWVGKAPLLAASKG